MAEKSLTDYQFWKNYWLSKDHLIFKIPNNYPFTKELRSIIRENKSQNLIEIGGFPGYYSVWASKELNLSATLLDFVILPELVDQLKVANNCTGNVSILEKDLFSNENNLHNSFDIAISNGLIEHFEDTKDIIKRHIDFLKPNGTLFISLPNFKGLNGWFQKTFDLDNYNKHYIPCMEIGFLENICRELDLVHINVEYTGGFMLWLENENKQPLWVKLFKKACWLPLKIFFKIIPIESQLFSPFILITAQKK
ncbi:class I SAM-dependent methyltransferase [Aquirufa sp. ROCK2-A2]